MVLARMDGIQTDFWGKGTSPQPKTNGAGYAFVRFLEGTDTDWYLVPTTNNPYPEEVYVHEWIHQIEGHYNAKGFSVPSADDALKYGYTDLTEGTGGWYKFYEDILSCNVLDPVIRISNKKADALSNKASMRGKSMKKNRILKGILLCMLMVICLSTTVSASYKIKNGKTNKWLSGKGSVIYKVSIPSGVYIKAQVEDKAEISVYSSYKSNRSNKFLEFWESGESYLMPKGTYYFSTGGFKFKLIMKKAPKNYDNYCMKKAKTIKAGKQVMVIQTPTNNYSRWYKIKLTKKKRINLWVTGGVTGSGQLNGVYILDTDGVKLDVVGAGNGKFYTYDVQPAGTYYIYLSVAAYRDDDVYKNANEWFSKFYTVKWK